MSIFITKMFITLTHFKVPLLTHLNSLPQKNLDLWKNVGLFSELTISKWTFILTKVIFSLVMCCPQIQESG